MCYCFTRNFNRLHYTIIALKRIVKYFNISQKQTRKTCSFRFFSEFHKTNCGNKEIYCFVRRV